MGFADGYYYGQGRIICDTSTFSVGDTIRVRSMTDSSKVWNQQVATVGTALVFTVPPYDYYKICTVQTINDTPTEIGGVYKTVDYGQTIFIDILDLHSLQGIQGILNAHNENDVLNIGDEVTIKINDGGTPKDWVMLIGGINIYDSHEVILVSKLATVTTCNGYNSGGYSTSPMFSAMSTFYSNIDERDRQFIKQKTINSGNANSVLDVVNAYVWIPTAFESQGASGYGVPDVEKSGNNIQFPIFTTQANRVKSTTNVGSGVRWWLASKSKAGNANYDCSIDIYGDGSHSIYSATEHLVPCFHLVADS